MDKNEAGVQDVIAKIEKFSDTYRAVGKQLHELITTTAPQLQPRLWYGMPGYPLVNELVWILTGCCGFILVCHRRYTSY
jgi:hypothetical protein